MTEYHDGLENLVSGLGTKAKDKRVSTEFNETSLSPRMLETMYANDWLSGKIIDIPAEDMLRKWRYINCPDISPEQIDKLIKAEKDFAIQAKLLDAIKWARLYGGSVIYLVMKDGISEEPLDYERIREGDLINLIVLDQNDVSVHSMNIHNIEEGNFRQPEYYNITGSAKRVHHSRMLRFDGVRLPFRASQRHGHWGSSVLVRLYDAILNSQTVPNSVSSLTYKAVVDVISIPGLMEKLTRPGAERSIMRRFALADLMKSNNNTLLLDDKETYTTHQIAFAGLKELIHEFLSIVSAASDIPATRLLGQSAQGMNATGEGDLKNYYDMISAKQNSELRPQINKLDNILVRSILGDKPDSWGFEFNSLWQMSDKETSEIEERNAKRDQAYYGMGVITPAIIARQLQSEDTYQHIDNEYIEALEQLDRTNEPEVKPEIEPEIE